MRPRVDPRDASTDCAARMESMGGRKWRSAFISALDGSPCDGQPTVIKKETDSGTQVQPDAQCVPRDTHTSFALDFM
jgi:hypothetical protein